MNLRSFARSGWDLSALGLCLLVTAVLAAPASAEIPDSLEPLIFGGEKRPARDLSLEGRRFEAMDRFAGLPFLLWPADAGREAPFGRDVPEIVAWLGKVGAQLGHRDFQPRYADRYHFRQLEVWEFELVRNGLVWHDHSLQVYWEGEQLAGIVNDVIGPIGDVEEPRRALEPDREWVYFEKRRDTGGVDLVLARLEQKTVGDRIETRVRSPLHGTMSTTYSSARLTPVLRSFEQFTEYSVPGTFPDQIDIDKQNHVWFSQPFQGRLTEFDPQTEQFIMHPTVGGNLPDGMNIDTKNRAWTGFNGGGGMGMVNKNTGRSRQYPAPYPGDAMAIPVYTSNDRVWITDHNANRISEFDPNTRKWLQSIPLPTANSWVVEGWEDPVGQTLYFTLYSIDRIGVKPLAGPAFTEFNSPPGGPAFPVVSNGKVYWSLWSRDRLCEYDIATGNVAQYTYPVANESGGPIGVMPDGRVVVGTRNVGYIFVFDPAGQTFDAYKIPTPFPGLKDGLVVGNNGTIWFTESGVDKLAKLHL